MNKCTMLCQNIVVVTNYASETGGVEVYTVEFRHKQHGDTLGAVVLWIKHPPVKQEDSGSIQPTAVSKLGQFRSPHFSYGFRKR